MKNCAKIAIFATLTLLFSGCASPMPGKVSQSLDPQKGAQIMAAEGRADASGLDWKPFPDLKNPIDAQIWKELLKKRDTGDCYGRICNYYGFYLVTVSTEPAGVQGFPSYFYDPKGHVVFKADEGVAYSLYRGDLQATPTNVIALVRHVLAVDGFQAFVVLNSTDIPHTDFTKENPNLPFKDWLLSKGIVINPPTFTKKNEGAEMSGFSEYNVFVYKPVGGELVRYEVRCRDGKISDLRWFSIGSDIGDCWYLL